MEHRIFRVFNVVHHVIMIVSLIRQAQLQKLRIQLCFGVWSTTI